MVGVTDSTLPDYHRIGRVLGRKHLVLSQGTVIDDVRQENGSYKGANKDIWNMVNTLQQ